MSAWFPIVQLYMQLPSRLQDCSDQWQAGVQVTWPLSTNERPVSRSRDHSPPIRGQYPGHVITLDPVVCSTAVSDIAELRYWEMTGQYFIQCINSALAANKSSTLDMFTCPHSLTSLIRDTWRRSVLFIILLNNIVLSSFIVYCLPVTLHNC